MGRMMCGVMLAEGEMFTAFVQGEKQAEEFFRLFGAPELSSRPTAGITTSHVRKGDTIMTAFEAQKEEMYKFLEIYDAYNSVQDISETLAGCGCDCGYSEGVLGKLTYIVDLIKTE